MVKLTKIYTRGGDGGETSLGDGARVRKDAPRVAAYGAVDEANSAVGVARLHASGDADAILARIQNDLFDLGADLCRPEDGARGRSALRVSADQVTRLESEIDALNAGLAPLESFVLPGGGAASAQLHVARTVTRRAERLAVALAAGEPVNAAALKYLNRLSDLLFVLARHCNAQGAGDVLWSPGENR
jgi:cob(I)alamin adenosyltransferase